MAFFFIFYDFIFLAEIHKLINQFLNVKNSIWKNNSQKNFIKKEAYFLNELGPNPLEKWIKILNHLQYPIVRINHTIHPVDIEKTIVQKFGVKNSKVNFKTLNINMIKIVYKVF